MSNTDEFARGQVIKKFEYDFDGFKMTVTKYHPWLRDRWSVLKGKPNFHKLEYYCEELHESHQSLQYLLILRIAQKNLGENQYTLVDGLSKALDISV